MNFGHLSWGKTNRLAQVFRRGKDGGYRTVMLAVDHPYFYGPTEGLVDPYPDGGFRGGAGKVGDRLRIGPAGLGEVPEPIGPGRVAAMQRKDGEAEDSGCGRRTAPSSSVRHLFLPALPAPG